MKIGAGLIALVAAGPPPPVSETCPHCVAFDQATQDFMQGTQGNIANSWLNLVNEACMTSPPNQQTACQLIMDIGFTNVLNNMLTMDPNAWCADLTFCKAQNPKFFAEEEVNAMASHCQPCTDMVNDVVLIAQNDKNHFDQIWTALSKQMCSQGIGPTEQKLCLKELANAQDGALSFMAKQDPKQACEAMFFC